MSCLSIGMFYIDCTSEIKYIYDVKLTAFSILALLDVIDLEIYRKGLSEFSTFAWGQRGII